MFSAASANGANYHWTFFCTLGRPGKLDENIRRLGGEIIYSPHQLGEKRAFFLNLRRIIKDGHYDVLHCHHDFVSAFYLWASFGLPIRKRIVHVHNTDEGILTPSRFKQFMLKEPMRQTCMRLADNVVGISNETLTKFTHRSNPKPDRDRIVYYGIDTSSFRERCCSREEFRLSLGLSPETRILLFTGRMAPIKNPCFVIDVLAELLKSEKNVAAVFAGSGELETTVRELAERKGVGDKIRILGWREDASTLMRLCDVLMFPRLEEPKEGLGLVLVEAQAAGLPILASPSITDDVQVIPEIFTILPLAAGANAWSEAVKRTLLTRQLSREECLDKIEGSRFSLNAGVSNLLSLYSDIN
jgi:glycosyltransferase involved in cell wall biosynthesis